MRNEEIVLEIKDMSKNFGETLALKNVSLCVKRGEVRGLIGENGSGKSTVSSIVAGIQPQTSGSMVFKGNTYTPNSALDAEALGIGMIVQEMGTVSGITVAENIFLGNEEKFKRHFFINSKDMNKEAKKALCSIKMNNIDPSDFIDRLDMQDRKMVEVAKVMHLNPEILIIDETTTALSQKGRTIIYEIMKKMKSENKTVLFISHDLEEVMEHCDSLSVLRDGELIKTLDKSEFNERDIKRYMVGREIGEHYYRTDNICSYSDEVIIHVENLSTGRGLTKGVSFDLHKGEILGIGGLSHCGMHEVGRALFGEEPIIFGSVTYEPDKTVITNARVAINCGMGFVSKNRDLEALALTATVRENIAGAGLDKIQNKGFIRPKNEKAYVNKQIENLSIKCSGINQEVKYLSGGNKQKVVFGKWIGRQSKILILDCPTRGVDIGVKASMYQLMEEMKNDGASILMISEEMTELIGMCDRLLIMKDGQINGEVHRGETFDENTVIEYMI